jgi:hypothetical protein
MTENMKKEAIERMKTLNLLNEKDGSIIKIFKETGRVFLSLPASGNRIGVIDGLSEEETKLVKAFEEEYDCLAYHVIRNETEFGVLYAILYVSSSEDEWEMDREDLTKDNGVMYPMSYVYNVGTKVDRNANLQDNFGEFGSIGVKSAAGGLVRVA